LEDIKTIYISVIEKLNNSAEGLDYLEAVAISCVFWNKSIGIQDATANDYAIYRNILNKTLLSFEHSSATNTSTNRNFAIYSLFSYINAVIPHTGRDILNNHEDLIDKLFWSDIAQGSELHGLSQTMRMRYATRSVLTCKE